MPFASISKKVALVAMGGLLMVGLSTLGATTAHADAVPTKIIGFVNANGAPLVGAKVCASVPAYLPETGYYNASPTCAVTDAQGGYGISFPLPVMTQMAAITVQGTNAYPETTPGTYRNGLGGYFTVNPGDTITKNITVKPYVSAPIKGYLTQVSGVATLDGAPLGGVEACAGAPIYDAQAKSYIDAASTCVTTGPTGAYKFSFVLPAESSMAAVWVNPGERYADIFPITTAGAGGRDIHGYFSIKPGESKTRNTAVRSYLLVTGKVVTKAGAPVAGALVDGGVKAVSTDASGAYAVRVRTAYDGGVVNVSAAGFENGFLQINAAGRPASGTTTVVLAPVSGVSTVAPAPVSSNPTVAPAPVVTKVVGTKPTISGKAKLGRVLTANPGVWGPQNVALSYQWYRNGKKIAGATTTTHKVVRQDLSKKITIKVTGRLTGSTPVTMGSAAAKKLAWR